MKAISLFSGVGGLDLAASIAGFNIIAHVEIDPFCRRVLEHHKHEYWKNAQTFGDVREFGKHSIETRDITLAFGGFPCQPFSISGSRKGKDDSRNMWGEFKRVIGEFKPQCVLLENVPAICNPFEVERIVPTSGANRFTRVRRRRYTRPAYALTVIKDLSEMGYVCQWGIVSARDAGAAHLRERWWLVGYAECRRYSGSQGEPIAHSDSIGNGARGEFGGGAEFHATISGGEVLEYASSEGLEGDGSIGFRQALSEPERTGEDVGNTKSQRCEKPGQSLRPFSTTQGGNGERNQFGNASRRFPESRMGWDASGLPSWLDGYRRPALINELEGCAQYPHEPPRTIAQKTPHHKDAIRGFGNAVFIPAAYQLFRAVKRELDCEAHAAEASG